MEPLVERDVSIQTRQPAKTVLTSGALCPLRRGVCVCVCVCLAEQNCFCLALVGIPGAHSRTQIQQGSWTLPMQVTATLTLPR